MPKSRKRLKKKKTPVPPPYCSPEMQELKKITAQKADEWEQQMNARLFELYEGAGIMDKVRNELM